jgi:hypothetical protein
MVLGTLDLDEFADANLVEVSDWELNFRMLKAASRDAEKLPNEVRPGPPLLLLRRSCAAARGWAAHGGVRVLGFKNPKEGWRGCRGGVARQGVPRGRAAARRGQGVHP